MKALIITENIEMAKEFKSILEEKSLELIIVESIAEAYMKLQEDCQLY